MSDTVLEIARRAKSARAPLAAAGIAARDAALTAMAVRLRAASTELLAANAADVKDAASQGVAPSFLDRLRLTEARVEKMACAIDDVVRLPSPVGRIEDLRTRPSGIRVGRMRIPLGVIAFIYEARPNVTSDATSLCLKAGNCIVLKGGRHAMRSNKTVVDVCRAALRHVGLPEDSVQMMPTADREAMKTLLALDDQIDLVIPRGGEGLIRFVAEHSRIPVLKHYKGVCHLFVDQNADLDMAVRLVDNSKAQRVSVCNSLETLLLHRDGAERLFPAIAEQLHKSDVALHCCPKSAELLADSSIPTVPADDDDYFAEYLSLDLAVRVVDDMDHAIAHIRKYGSDHTESIVTSDHASAMRFVAEVDSSCVLVNTSTRLADGGELGLGAEIGISTTRLHAFGPMGLEELTTRKFVVFGDGQIRT